MITAFMTMRMRPGIGVDWNVVPLLAST